MKERIEKILLITLGFSFLMLLVLLAGVNPEAKANDEEIEEISTQLNKLKDDKMQCLDELTYLQSVEDATGKTRYCVEYDELIMEKQAQLDEILNKEYEQVGLMMNR